MPVSNIKNTERILENTLSQIRRREQIQDFGFNLVGGMPADTLNPVSNSQMIKDSLNMWQKNPLANSIIETFLDYTLGSGIEYEATSPAVKEVLDMFWNDPDNDWANKQVDRFRDLSLFGELLLETSVIAGRGKVKINSIYPELIKSMKRDEYYYERLISITVNKSEEDKELNLIKYDPINKKYDGDCFYFTVNKSTFQSRGLSDLFVNRDWLNLHDKSLYANIERAGLLLSFVWDVTIKGGTEEQMRKKFQAISNNPPRAGSFRIHDENEVWEEKTPNLGGRDFTDIYKLLKGQISGGSRQPVFMFGAEGDINRATAREMSKPFYKKINRRQKLIKHIIASMFDFQISKAIEHNYLDADIDTSYKITLPNANEDVAMDIADTIFKFSSSLTVLTANNLIDKKTSKAVIDMLLAEMGIAKTEDIEDVETQESMIDVSSKYFKKYKEVVQKV